MKKLFFPILLSAVILTACSKNPPATPGSTPDATPDSRIDSSTNSEATFILETPSAGTKITSPVIITGKARGSMYFEGTFPITIEDMNEKVLGSGIAKATTNWMTEDFVPFTVTISFTTGTTIVGDIVMKNDNPSSLPENEHSAKFPVSFK